MIKHRTSNQIKQEKDHAFGTNSVLALNTDVNTIYIEHHSKHEEIYDQDIFNMCTH